MKKSRQVKPNKKSDRQLYQLVRKKISTGDYVFLKHAKQRLEERNILDLDVLDILEGKQGHKRKRNKSKDKYENTYDDWNYCVEEANLDGRRIRIILSFEKNLMLIITVIRFNT